MEKTENTEQIHTSHDTTLETIIGKEQTTNKRNKKSKRIMSNRHK